jgi:hypothetical protein
LLTLALLRAINWAHRHNAIYQVDVKERSEKEIMGMWVIKASAPVKIFQKLVPLLPTHLGVLDTRPSSEI